MSAFTIKERQELQAFIEDDVAKASGTASINRRSSTVLAFACLLFGLLVIICSAIASLKGSNNPTPWSVASTIFGGFTTAVGAFATSQLKFAERERIWQRKADLLRALSVQLRYGEPNKDSFLPLLASVRAFGDHTQWEEVEKAAHKLLGA